MPTVWTSLATLVGYAVATALGATGEGAVLTAVAAGLLGATAASCRDSSRRSHA